MIAKETAARIWNCYREIETAHKLLEKMEVLKNKYPHDPTAQKLKDAFGRAQDLQLGVPSGENSHRLFSVSPELGKSVIESHIARKQAELVDANEQARIELDLE